MALNVNSGQSHEAQFGPPSAPINIAQFLQTALKFEQGSDDHSPCSVFSHSVGNGKAQEWLTLNQTQHEAIETECSVGDIQESLNEVVSNPRLFSHVIKTHEAAVQSIYETAESSSRRKRKRVTVTEPADEHAGVASLRSKLDAVQLTSWPLTLNSALFIRTPRHADHNTLVETKRLNLSSDVNNIHQALIFVTVHSPLSWGHKLLARSSQHVLLSSQTLGDLYDVIPCPSNEIPEEVENDDGMTNWHFTQPGCGSTGAVICIEETMYGDAQTERDYSDKLQDLIQRIPEKRRPTLSKGPPMHETNFDSLVIRLHTPYWLLHAGNCEHFLVFEHIRLIHPSDPPLSSYPLTTQITPPLLDNCRICNKVPAVYSVVGDIRLGESPFVVCAPCWRWMGMPKGEGAKNVTVVPLPKHEFGWNA
ncbi:unnamed protein product [Somion occarium]